VTTRSARLTLALLALSLFGAPLLRAATTPDKPRQIGDEHWRQGSGPLNDSDIEQLARGVAYRGGTTRDEIMGDRKLAEHLSSNGLKMLDAIGDPKTDMQAMLIRDLRTGQVHVVFRGTEPDKAIASAKKLSLSGDVKADLDGRSRWMGAGYTQYQANKAKLGEWADKYPGKLVVSGHSLGGALGQHFIVAHPDAVKSAALFNAPGIGQLVADRTIGTELPPIRYYRNPNDLVDKAHGKHVRGEVYNVTASPNDGYYEAHCDPILQGNKGVKVEKGSYDAWQRGCKDEQEAAFRKTLQEKSDELLRGMKELALKASDAHRAKDDDAARDALRQYEESRAALGELFKTAVARLPGDDSHESKIDEQLRDIHGRRMSIERYTPVKELRTELATDLGAKPEKPEQTKPETTNASNAKDPAAAATPGTAPAQGTAQSGPATPQSPSSDGKDAKEESATEELAQSIGDPKEEAGVGELAPASSSSKEKRHAKSKKDAKHDVVVEQAESEASAEAIAALLEAEGFNEAQAAALARYNAQVESAQNLDDLLSAIAAAMADAGGSDSSSSEKTRRGAKTGAKPAPNRKGACNKPCGPAKKSR
jgi:pimeloyl-ACP methyl ester carboxylesterase